MKALSGLYFVTDRKLSRGGILEDTRAVVGAGCRVVQYREKELPAAEMIAEAGKIAGLCRESNVLFLVNDRVDVALAVDADGVHLGSDDMPIEIARRLLGKEKIIGLSVGSLQEAIEAGKKSADYVSVGPVFHTDTKKNAGKPVGTTLIREIKQRLGMPVVAIGGINEENVQQILEAGVDAVAMISAIVCAENVGEKAKKIVEKIGGRE